MDLPHLLSQSLNFQTSKEATASLTQLETQPQFALQLLQTAANADFAQDVRLAAALYFKNLIKKKWTDLDGNYLLPLNEVNLIKENLINLMVNSPKQVSKQLSDACALIAQSDFPERWPDLVSILITKLDSKNAETSLSVLDLLHQVFSKWRSLERSNELFLEIKMVLEQFTLPYLNFISQIDQQISSTGDIKFVELMDLLIQIFYDLNCQDLPEFFEDHISDFMTLMLKYLNLEVPKTVEFDDEQPSVYELLKTSVCEAVTLYVERYEEEFLPFMPKFVECLWTLLTTTGQEVRFDVLVNRCLTFLTSVARFERNLHLFQNEETLVQIIERIIIPNMKMRQSDLELFEDEPLDFVRQDVEGSDSSTRRLASQQFLKELNAKMETQVTTVVKRYIAEFNKSMNFLDKSAASALFTAIAAKGQITQQGVSFTNPLLNVVEYFSQQMAPELTNSNAHPVLKTDAIRFVLNFRTQLNKQQLSEVLPLLVSKISLEENQVVYTYASICLERLLSLRDQNQKSLPMFTEQDVALHVRAMSTQTLKIIASGSTKVEELAANEFLMRLLMRILVVAGGEVKHVAALLVPQLVNIAVAVSSNPSNPKFNHYLFESIGACLRHYTDYERLDAEVVQPLFGVLGNDVTEFVPYILQLLTLVLYLQPAEKGLPPSFQQLLKPVLSPQLWSVRGNVPALVMLLQVIVSRGPSLVIEMNLLMPLLGVFQNMLASSANDQYTFELLYTIFTSIPAPSLAPALPQIGNLLLLRLEKKGHEKYSTALMKFVFQVAATQPSELSGPEFIISLFNTSKPQSFLAIFTNILMPKVLQIHGFQNRKVASVGLTNLLCNTQHFVNGELNGQLFVGLKQLTNLLTQTVAEDTTAQAVTFDVNEQVFGFAFSPLATTKVQLPNPVSYVTESPSAYFKQQFERIAPLPQVQQQLTDELRGVIMSL